MDDVERQAEALIAKHHGDVQEAFEEASNNAERDPSEFTENVRDYLQHYHV